MGRVVVELGGEGLFSMPEKHERRVFWGWLKYQPAEEKLSLNTVADLYLLQILRRVEHYTELSRLGWRLLTSLWWKEALQYTAYVWVKDNTRYVTHRALFSGEPNGYGSFIKLLSDKEMHGLIASNEERGELICKEEGQ